MNFEIDYEHQVWYSLSELAYLLSTYHSNISILTTWHEEQEKEDEDQEKEQ